MLQAGVLVELVGLQQQPAPLGEHAKRTYDFNGTWAQLMEEETPGQWIAAALTGQVIKVRTENLRLLNSIAFGNYDMVLGPKSEVPIVAAEIVSQLQIKGYCNLQYFLSDASIHACLETAEKLNTDGHLSRINYRFEEGYLGLGGTGRTISMDFNKAELPDYVKQSCLAQIDANISALSLALRPHVDDSLGFSIYSRTNLLLRTPLPPHQRNGADVLYSDLPEDEGLDEGFENTSSHLEEPTNGEAQSFLQYMRRGKILVLLFIGPGEGRIRLVERCSCPTDQSVETGERSDSKEIFIPCESRTMVVIHTEKFDWSLDEPNSDFLVLQSWFLDAPLTFSIAEDQIEGDLSLLEPSHGPTLTGKRCGVVSLYNRYAIGATGHQQYWTAFGKAGGDGALLMPYTRWDWSVYYTDDTVDCDGKFYCKHFSPIEGINLFDNRFFNLSVGEAYGMDPSQRHIMEVCYSTLKGAGYELQDLQRTPRNIGVFVGNDHYDWKEIPKDCDMGGAAYGGAGASPPILANRFNYCCNLRGPSVMLDTACSSSLVATNLAKSLLQDGTERMPCAIVCGVMTILSPYVFIGNCAAHMLSPSGRCFTFNASANGFLRCEAVGSICLKYDDYGQDKHYAMLSGSSANQDGRSASLTAPNGPAQVGVIHEVLREYGLTPNEVDISECHGTATALGDPIEVGSVRKVFDPRARGPPRHEPLMFGSVKSNHGHAEGGAGLTGFIKCILQTMHQEASECLHISRLNPHMDFSGFPNYMLQETAVTRADSCFAGVSSFGFGGTNAHCQAWGKNIVTSRHSNGRQLHVSFLKKLDELPPAKVSILPGHWENWVNHGIDSKFFDEAERSNRSVHVNVNWKEQSFECTSVELQDEPEYGFEFALYGPFNNWSLEALEMNPDISGLFATTIVLDGQGEAEFQVIADNKRDMIYGPPFPRCRSKVQDVLGPSELKAELTWLIRGKPHELFEVEFYKKSSKTAVTWRRCG